MSYILYNTTIHTQLIAPDAPVGTIVKEAFEKWREQPERHTVDGKPIVLPEHIVELEIIRQPRPENVGAQERAVSFIALDLPAKTITHGYNIVPWTADEIAAHQADLAERDQITTLLATCAEMRSHTGTGEQRLARLENFLGRLGPYLVKKGLLP